MQLDRVLFPLLLVVGFVNAPAESLAAEQRCSELGGACLCSDSLASSDFPSWANPSSAAWDPSESPDATECGGDFPNNGSMEVDPSFEYWNPAGSDFPSGANINVLRTYGGGITNMHFTGRGHCPGSERVCSRWYRRWASDFPPQTTCPNREVKQFEATGGQIQGSVGTDRFSMRYQVGGDLDMPWSGDKLDPQDCKNQWCRFEVCVSGAVCGSGSMTLEWWINGVEDGREMRFGPVTQTTGGDSYTRPVINMWTTCSGSRTSAWNEVSHLVGAAWSLDAGQRIGAAYEVEGSGGPPPSLPAPVIFDD